MTRPDIEGIRSVIADDLDGLFTGPFVTVILDYVEELENASFLFQKNKELKERCDALEAGNDSRLDEYEARIAELEAEAHLHHLLPIRECQHCVTGAR